MYIAQRYTIPSLLNATNTLVERVTESPTTTSDAPFFTSGIATGQSNSESERSENETKTALEWAFAIAALLAIASLTTWRYAQLRRNNQSMRSFLSRSRLHRTGSRERILNARESRRSIPRTTGLPRMRTLSGNPLPVSDPLFYPPSLSHGRYPEPLEPTPVHLATSASLPMTARGRGRERHRRVTQGADIDALGRPIGRPDSDDWAGDDKEDLPAYESVAIGGPPRYGERDMHFLGGASTRVLASPLSALHSPTESTSAERGQAVERALQTINSNSSANSPNSPFADHQRPSESQSSMTSSDALHAS